MQHETTPNDIHTCSYSCDRPACIRAQRDELAARVEQDADAAGVRTASIAPAEAKGDWPDYVMLRDTKLYDDAGGLGQRIFTTAGAGYQKVKYVRADLATTPQPTGGDAVAWMEPHECGVINAQTKAMYAWAAPYTIPLYTTPPAADALADTQRAIIKAAERRGYERARAEQPAGGEAVGAVLELVEKWTGRMVTGATDAFDTGGNCALRQCADELEAALGQGKANG